MKISFEFEWDINDFFREVKQKYLNTVCKINGHIWEKYIKPKDRDGLFGEKLMRHYQDAMIYGSGFWQADYGGEKIHTHTCKRCGEYKYKIKKSKQKPRTTKFSRYSKLSNT